MILLRAVVAAPLSLLFFQKEDCAPKKEEECKPKPEECKPKPEDCKPKEEECKPKKEEECKKEEHPKWECKKEGCKHTVSHSTE